MRGMRAPRRNEAPATVVKKTQQPKTQKLSRRIKRRRSTTPESVKVTRLRPHDRVYVGNRWYVVRGIRMIGKKSGKTSICIVNTMEKGGMHFRSTARVRKADPDAEI